jgi:hypothetical protein
VRIEIRADTDVVADLIGRVLELECVDDSMIGEVVLELVGLEFV